MKDELIIVDCDLIARLRFEHKYFEANELINSFRKSVESDKTVIRKQLKKVNDWKKYRKKIDINNKKCVQCNKSLPIMYKKICSECNNINRKQSSIKSYAKKKRGKNK